MPGWQGIVVVVMDWQKYMYIDEVMKHLDNRTNYAIFDSDLTADFFEQMQTTLTVMLCTNQKQLQFFLQQASKLIGSTPCHQRIPVDPSC